jgi:hypothetical protein
VGGRRRSISPRRRCGIDANQYALFKRGDVRSWPIASIRTHTLNGRYRGIADIVQHWHEIARWRMTQSGHSRLESAGALNPIPPATDHCCNHLIVSIVGVVGSLGRNNATTRFHHRNRIDKCMAARRACAAADHSAERSSCNSTPWRTHASRFASSEARLSLLVQLTLFDPLILFHHVLRDRSLPGGGRSRPPSTILQG